MVSISGRKVGGFSHAVRRWTDSRGKGRSQEGEASWAFTASKGGFGRNLVPSHDDEQESFPNWSGRRADTLLLGVDASNAR